MAEYKYTPADFKSDQEVRWCPGCGDHAILSAVQRALPEIADATDTPHNLFHVRVGHRLLVAVHLLHEDLRVPFGARPRQRRGHGRQGRQPAPQRLGHHGRRRLAGHRRQPLHTRHPPQCRPERHTLQQRDLRPHQGAVLPPPRSWARSPRPRPTARSKSRSTPANW